MLRRDVVAHWGSKSIHEIRKRDASDLLNLIAQRNTHASHRLLKTLKTFFRWCIGRAVIESSPAEGLSSSYREDSRDRVLSDQELAAITIAAREMPSPYGGIVEFLALTGQRREEVAQLKWDELDEQTRTWTIPGSRTKNKKAANCGLLDQFVGSIRKRLQSRVAAHNFLDGLGAPAALHAAAETVVNLTHPHPLRGLRKGGNGGMHLLVAERVARADDHDFCPRYSGIVPGNSGIVPANSGIGPRLKLRKAERGRRSIPPRAP